MTKQLGAEAQATIWKLMKANPVSATVTGWPSKSEARTDADASSTQQVAAFHALAHTSAA
jgi:exo-beta-1,3-glucanase (GH17 family)